MQLAVVVLDHLQGKRQDVLSAFAQRRDGQGHHVQAVVEILAELAFADGIFQIRVRGRDQPDVDGNRARASQSHEGSFLQHAEEFGLYGGGHVADLIQKQGSAVGPFQQPFLAASRIGEGTRFIAKQFALQQGLGQGGAVQFQQRHIGARAGVVDGAGEDAFASTALAQDQNGGAVSLRRFLRHLEHGAHGGVFGNHAAEVVPPFGRLDVVPDTHPQRQHFAGPAQRFHQVGEMEGLDQVVEGPGLHGLHRAVHHVVRAHHQDDGGGIGRLHAAQNLDSVNAGHHNVEQDKVGRLFSEDS